MGNEAWSEIFFGLTNEIEKIQKSATVSVHLYNPENMAFSLAKLCSKGDYSYMPSFQLIVSNADEVVLYFGRVVWNGKHVSMRGQEWIEVAFGSVEEYLCMQIYGEQFERDDLACGLLGLSSVILEVQGYGTQAEVVTVLSLKDGRQIRTPIADFKQLTIEDFYFENEFFRASLVNDVGGFSVGWVN